MSPVNGFGCLDFICIPGHAQAIDNVLLKNELLCIPPSFECVHLGCQSSLFQPLVINPFRDIREKTRKLRTGLWWRKSYMIDTFLVLILAALWCSVYSVAVLEGRLWHFYFTSYFVCFTLSFRPQTNYNRLVDPLKFGQWAGLFTSFIASYVFVFQKSLMKPPTYYFIVIYILSCLGMLILDKSIIIQETLHRFLCHLKGGFCIKLTPIISIVLIVRYHKSSLLMRISL